jgi:serine/threonine-protein kinase HipA
MTPDGEYDLSPAFDVLPSGQALGFQQMRVGADAADSTLDNALSECELFGLDKSQAREQTRHVCKIVAGWKEHFARADVTDADIESLAGQIDRPFLLDQRKAFT